MAETDAPPEAIVTDDPAPTADQPVREWVDTFDEYKFFVESTQQLSNQRQSANQFYLTINTGVPVAVGFLLEHLGTRGWLLVSVSVPVLIVGIVSCLIWHTTIDRYRALIGWRFDQLTAMEASPRMAGNQRIFTREWEEFFKPLQGKQLFGFSTVERILPRVMIVTYTAYLAVLVIGVSTGLL